MAHSRGFRQSLARQATAFAAAFGADMAAAKKEFDVIRRTASAHASGTAPAAAGAAPGAAGTARVAGQVAAALQLVRRIEDTWTALQARAPPRSG